MVKSQSLLSLALATLLLGSCVYVPPPGYYGGPPPPPGVPPPYHFDGPPPPPDYYYGRGKARRDYEMQFSYRPRGRTEYLREADPDYAVEDPIDGQAGEAMSPDDQPLDPGPSPSQSPAEPPPAPAPKIDPNSVPYATKSNTPGRAKSPYPPYRELDVSGMKSGSMAKDPTTGKVFRVP